MHEGGETKDIAVSFYVRTQYYGEGEKETRQRDNKFKLFAATKKKTFWNEDGKQEVITALRYARRIKFI